MICSVGCSDIGDPVFSVGDSLRYLALVPSADLGAVEENRDVGVVDKTLEGDTPLPLTLDYWDSTLIPSMGVFNGVAGEGSAGGGTNDGENEVGR